MQADRWLQEGAQETEPDAIDREYPARPIVGVGAVILVAPAEARACGWSEPFGGTGVVLVKRLFEPLAGQWSLPGGTLEVGETLEAAWRVRSPRRPG